jgi:hypothetical protein
VYAEALDDKVQENVKNRLIYRRAGTAYLTC